MPFLAAPRAACGPSGRSPTQARGGTGEGVGDTLRQVWRWWLGQMLALLGGAEGAPGALADGLVLDVSGGLAAARLLRRRGGRLEALGPLRLAPAEGAAEGEGSGLRRLARRAPLSLRVPAGWMLQHEAALPLAAEPVLPEVLRHELGRLTPFTEAEVLWDHATLGRDAARGRLRVLLVLALRAPLDPVLGALARAGLRPERVEPDGDGAALRLRRAGRHRLTLALLGLCAGLAVLALVVPVVRQSLALDRVERRMAAVAPAVARSGALRRRLAREGAGGDVLAAGAARAGGTLAALSEVTALVPDGTFLTALTLKGRELTLEGRSDHAAGLIAALSAPPDPHDSSPRDHGLRDVQFTAPVTHGPSGEDAFALRARVGGVAADPGDGPGGDAAGADAAAGGGG